MHTPGIEDDTFLQLSVTPTSLYLSFDMEEALNPSQADSLAEQDFSANDDSSIDDITSFVDMLNSNSDKIKFEAASALLHVLSINHANTGKFLPNPKSRTIAVAYNRYSHFNYIHAHLKLWSVGQYLFY